MRRWGQRKQKAENKVLKRSRAGSRPTSPRRLQNPRSSIQAKQLVVETGETANRKTTPPNLPRERTRARKDNRIRGQGNQHTNLHLRTQKRRAQKKPRTAEAGESADLQTTTHGGLAAKCHLRRLAPGKRNRALRNIQSVAGRHWQRCLSPRRKTKPRPLRRRHRERKSVPDDPRLSLNKPPSHHRQLPNKRNRRPKNNPNPNLQPALPSPKRIHQHQLPVPLPLPNPNLKPLPTTAT